MTNNHLRLKQSKTAEKVLSEYLTHKSDVIRCLAMNALQNCGEKVSSQTVDILIGLLEDIDPDVRSDAMMVLVDEAKDSHWEIIYRSLIGDPVKEVKIYAIRSLARLKSQTSVEIIHRLAFSRCEDEVAWEDYGSPWDDWLEIQVESINALGEMRVFEAIDGLLELRRDEMTQELDTEIFSAISRMSGVGVDSLVGLLRKTDEKNKVAILKVLKNVDLSLLESLSTELLTDKLPEVRSLAIEFFLVEPSKLEEFYLKEEDIQVRRLIVKKILESDKSFAVRALEDEDSLVRVMGVEALDISDFDSLPLDIEDKLRSWVKSSRVELAICCISRFIELVCDDGLEVLREICLDSSFSWQVRIASIRELEVMVGDSNVSLWTSLLCDPVQQIRVVTLTVLESLARGGRTFAKELLLAAASGEIGKDIARGNVAEGGDYEDNLVASKVEEVGNVQSFRITRGGEIEYLDEDREGFLTSSATSTLDSIQSFSSQRVEEGNTESVTDFRKQRLSVEGPSGIGEDLQNLAIRRLGVLPFGEVEDFLWDKVLTVSESNERLRVSALFVLESFSQDRAVSEERLKTLVDYIKQDYIKQDYIKQDIDDPQFRAYCARVIFNSMEDPYHELKCLSEDRDALVRSIVAESAILRGIDETWHFLVDSSVMVRKVVLQRLVSLDDDDILVKAVDMSLKFEIIDNLNYLYHNHSSVKGIFLTKLSSLDLSERDVRVLLMSIY